MLPTQIQTSQDVVQIRGTLRSCEKQSIIRSSSPSLPLILSQLVRVYLDRHGKMRTKRKEKYVSTSLNYNERHAAERTNIHLQGTEAVRSSDLNDEPFMNSKNDLPECSHFTRQN